MKILENDFAACVNIRDDPGAYPSGAGSGPLPSCLYVEEVVGALKVQFDPGDAVPWDLAEFADDHAELPFGISADEWVIHMGDDRTLIFEVGEFNDDDWLPPKADRERRESA